MFIVRTSNENKYAAAANRLKCAETSYETMSPTSNFSLGRPAARRLAGGLWRHRPSLSASWLLLPRNTRRPIRAFACRRRQTDDPQSTCLRLYCRFVDDRHLLISKLRECWSCIEWHKATGTRIWTERVSVSRQPSTSASFRRGGKQAYEFCHWLATAGSRVAINSAHGPAGTTAGCRQRIIAGKWRAVIGAWLPLLAELSWVAVLPFISVAGKLAYGTGESLSVTRHTAIISVFWKLRSKLCQYVNAVAL